MLVFLGNVSRMNPRSLFVLIRTLMIAPLLYAIQVLEFA